MHKSYKRFHSTCYKQFEPPYRIAAYIFIIHASFNSIFQILRGACSFIGNETQLIPVSPCHSFRITWHYTGTIIVRLLEHPFMTSLHDIHCFNHSCLHPLRYCSIRLLMWTLKVFCELLSRTDSVSYLRIFSTMASSLLCLSVYRPGTQC